MARRAAVLRVSRRHPGGHPITTATALTLSAQLVLERVTGPLDTVVVAGGIGHEDAAGNPLIVSHVRRLAKESRRVASVCTGSYILAAAGLLDGRRATTHWHQAERMAELYPDVVVDPDPIFIRDGNVATSAGITAALDLMLAFVEEDNGTELARTVARNLVTYLQRPGDQAQMSMFVSAPSPANSLVKRTLEHISAHLRDDLSTATLAIEAGVSERHLTRLFLKHLGQTPGRYVRQARTEAAAHLLASTSLPMAAVAVRCGFGTAETLRQAFIDRYGIPLPLPPDASGRLIPALARVSAMNGDRVVGGYTLRRLLGRGGMGEVHLAATPTGGLAAVKLIHPHLAGDPVFRRRFEREAAAARRVARFCTAPVLDAGIDGNVAYLVTEYVKGPDLAQAVHEQGPLSGANLEALAVGVATALSAIHGAGVIHRDLKPSNVLLSPLGPRVIDFGVAQLVNDSMASQAILGTPAFMAPEQARGEPLTPAADVFAWGGVIAFAGTGGRPSGARTPRRSTGSCIGSRGWTGWTKASGGGGAGAGQGRAAAAHGSGAAGRVGGRDAPGHGHPGGRTYVDGGVQRPVGAVAASAEQSAAGPVGRRPEVVAASGGRPEVVAASGGRRRRRWPWVAAAGSAAALVVAVAAVTLPGLASRTWPYEAGFTDGWAVGASDAGDARLDGAAYELTVEPGWRLWKSAPVQEPENGVIVSAKATLEEGEGSTVCGATARRAPETVTSSE
ncbi:DJ-1/PfpI family protein [Nonomuraea thailandensis]